MKRFVLLLALAGCATTPPKPLPPLPGVATCTDVCNNGRRLNCTFVQPTPAGASCEKVCENNQQVGISPFDLDCRARAPSCAEIDNCQ